MELRKVEHLLESYFEGTTSLQEEQVLRDYFTGNSVAPHLEEYVALFSAFAKAETQTYDVPITVPKKQFRIPSWLQIAAVAAVAFGIFWQVNSTPKIGGTYADNPDKAREITKNAFGLMSQMLNQSTAQLGVVKEFDNATSDIIN